MRTKDRVELAGMSDPGCVRKNNEDNFAVEPDLGLLVVADGMGGHNSGEVASDIACKTVVEYARKMIGGEKTMVPEGGTPGLTPRGRQLEFFVKTANAMIYEKGRAFPKDAGMGTTVVAAIVDAKSMTVAHVGDSRLYLWRRGELTQLTEDHSLVGEQVKRGQITADEAALSPAEYFDPCPWRGQGRAGGCRGSSSSSGRPRAARDRRPLEDGHRRGCRRGDRRVPGSAENR